MFILVKKKKTTHNVAIALAAMVILFSVLSTIVVYLSISLLNTLQFPVHFFLENILIISSYLGTENGMDPCIDFSRRHTKK